MYQQAKREKIHTSSKPIIWIDFFQSHSYIQTEAEAAGPSGRPCTPARNKNYPPSETNHMDNGAL